MTNHGFNRQWAREFESRFGQRGGWSGGWGAMGRPPGPPPWISGLFGLAAGEPPRGPRARRGDVRVAILAVLADEPLNGYQVIQQISDRTDGGWRPSPGSVYPTISQLEDEGLIEADDERSRRTLRLTDAGRAYLTEHADEVAQVWAPFGGNPAGAKPEPADFTSLKPELGRMMNAVWQIITTGTDEQRRQAIGVLVEARRGLYGILADHPGDDEVDHLEEVGDGESGQDGDSTNESGARS